MARTIVVNFEGEVSEFELTRLSREKLYGKKVREVVDEDGNETETAYLTRDGSTLLLKGAMASLYVDDEFDVAERSELVAVGEDGEPLDEVESTLGVEQELQGPVPASRVLDHNAKAVYQLDPDTLSDKLLKHLEGGEIFETKFNYRTGFDWNPMFLLQNEFGIFAIVGEPSEFEFLHRKPVEPLDDDDEDPFDDDELDFSMM